MKQFCLLFIVIAIFFSCDKKKLTTEELVVSSKGFNYWLDVNNEDSTLYFDYLDKNGKWLVFLYKNGIFEKHETPNDVVRTEEWHLQNDSTIVKGESSINNILKLTADTMILYNNLLNKTFEFIVAPDSLIPKEYKKIQY